MSRSHRGQRGRYTPKGTVSTEPEDESVAPMRERNPLTYWTAIVLVALMVLSGVAAALAALLGN